MRSIEKHETKIFFLHPIEVLDVNENQHPPRFETFFLETAVPENMPVGSLVTSVTAHDLDIGDKVSYSIKGKK